MILIDLFFFTKIFQRSHFIQFKEGYCTTGLDMSYPCSYSILSKLEESVFSKVYLLQHTNGEKYTLKVTDASKTKKNETKEEVEVLMRLNHPHLVQCCNYFLSGESDLYLLLEHNTGGTLSRAIEKNIPEPKALKWFSQLADAIRYLHSMKVIHRDLRPDNIFLDNDGNIKIGDLGTARQQETVALSGDAPAGTPCYMSPQIINGKPYTEKSDIWSLGCIFYEILAQQAPFSFPKLSSIIYEHPPAIPNMAYGLNIRFFINTILDKDDARRPSAQWILDKVVELQGKPYIPGPNVHLPKVAVDKTAVHESLRLFHEQGKLDCLQTSEAGNSSSWWYVPLAVGAGLLTAALLSGGKKTKEGEGIDKNPKK
ncbi:unnamed protein product [Lymnaea stagnalis]|uniref:non-specific serine/threonine protein kinase n=1 Tax=Lymnaea stagnalis TaxID=6523 RepID=A0AAV2H419_LYMST